MSMMIALKHIREQKGYSQRRFAKMASLSFRGLQLIEQREHDMRLSSLRKAAGALHLPENGIPLLIEEFLGEDEDSVRMVSFRIMEDGYTSWPLHLFDFVDALRARRNADLVTSAPFAGLHCTIVCLLASTVETLCGELGVRIPGWCVGIASLQTPWFVAGVENLKATALAESPVHFRKRNIFVLGNFLDRV